MSERFTVMEKKSSTGLLNRLEFVVKLRALFDGAHSETHQTLCRYSSAVVEQLTCNQQVPSSTLGGGTTFSLYLSLSGFSSVPLFFRHSLSKPLLYHQLFTANGPYGILSRKRSNNGV